MPLLLTRLPPVLIPYGGPGLGLLERGYTLCLVPSKSQKQGILELEEAHLAWECFQEFTRKEEDNNIDSSV